MIRVSLPGFDVKRARPHECSIDSDYSNPKIKKRQDPPHRSLIQLGLKNTYQPGDTIVYTMPHGYGYTPMVWAVISDNSGNSIFGFQPYSSGGLGVNVKTDSTNMYIVVSSPIIPRTPNIILNISYGLFADNGAKNA